MTLLTPPSRWCRCPRPRRPAAPTTMAQPVSRRWAWLLPVFALSLLLAGTVGVGIGWLRHRLAYPLHAAVTPASEETPASKPEPERAGATHAAGAVSEFAARQRQRKTEGARAQHGSGSVLPGAQSARRRFRAVPSARKASGPDLSMAGTPRTRDRVGPAKSAARIQQSLSPYPQ